MAKSNKLLAEVVLLPWFEKVTVLLVAMKLLPLPLLTLKEVAVDAKERKVTSSFAVMMPENTTADPPDSLMVLRPEEPVRTVILLAYVADIPVCNVAVALPVVSPTWMVGPVAPPKEVPAASCKRSVPALIYALPPERLVLAPERVRKLVPVLVISFEFPLIRPEKVNPAVPSPVKIVLA